MTDYYFLQQEHIQYTYQNAGLSAFRCHPSLDAYVSLAAFHARVSRNVDVAQNHDNHYNLADDEHHHRLLHLHHRRLLLSYHEKDCFEVKGN